MSSYGRYIIRRILQKRKSFSDKGVRLVIRDLEKQRKRFEKVTTEVEIIVTPYKLLHNGEALGRLTTEEEYTEAIQELRKNIT
ncbi:hypothetical protein [Anaerobutyricum hallii]|uniref:hypothetical protein n=1 Tax=Anaerobutyricum hallii TaxID=39488 RepID=UPI00266C3688|nr:hypothetical protein [Anaerobutyricum hallii]